MNALSFRDTLRAAIVWSRLLLVCLYLLLGALPIRATSVVAPDFPQLVNESDYIVRAVVKSVSSEWREFQGRRHIFTKVELDVIEVIAGKPPQPLVLEMLGGRVGDEEMTVVGAPKFKLGDEDVLFIQGNGKNISPLVGIMHGRYPVMKDKATGREYIARNNKVPLQDTAEVGLPVAEGAAAKLQSQMKSPATALTPADFVQRIKKAVNPAFRKLPQR